MEKCFLFLVLVANVLLTVQAYSLDDIDDDDIQELLSDLESTLQHKRGIDSDKDDSDTVDEDTIRALCKQIFYDKACVDKCVQNEPNIEEICNGPEVDYPDRRGRLSNKRRGSYRSYRWWRYVSTRRYRNPFG